MNNLIEIKISDIDSFQNHPFLLIDDESFKELANSIKENGLLNPIIVRPKNNGRYELISGHRRRKAMELIGIDTINAYIKDFNDDEATICMVDSNIYREKVLPSEKAFAYKMKMDAMKHQGKVTLDHEGPRLSSEKVGKKFGDSSTSVKRYIRLTNLIPELLELVDNTVKYDKRTFLTMGLKPAVELSYLNKDEQNLIYSSITYADLTPSHAQAIKIRELSKMKKLNFNIIEEIFCQKKGNQNEQITFNKTNIESVLPREILKRDKRYIEEYIVNAIKKYNEIKNQEFQSIDRNRFN